LSLSTRASSWCTRLWWSSGSSRHLSRRPTSWCSRLA